jgi:biopolymer transport protein ExbB
VLLPAVLFLLGRTQAMPQAAAGAPGSAPAARAAQGDGAARAAQGDAAPANQELIATSNVFRIMREGGVLMYPIAFCSLVTLAFVLERLTSLRRGRVIPKPFVTRFVQQVREGQLDRAEALALCEDNRSPVAAVFAGAVRKWGRPAVEVEQAIIDAGERATNGLRRYLRVFSAVSTIAPLLGLLGTVFGMIQAFNAVAVSDALGRPELLAKGVSQALLTTAFGLVVAIPALLVYYVFVSRVDHLITEIDALGQELVHLISAEEMQVRGDEARVAKSRRPRRDAAA